MKKLIPLLLASATCFASEGVIEEIITKRAPPPFGAYAQALSVDLEKTQKLIFVSGQVAVNPNSGLMIEDTIENATNQTLDNIQTILKKAGTDMAHVVRMDVFLQNMDRDWDGMNKVYQERFPNGVYPVRQTVGVKMDDNTLVEISCIAIVPKH